MCYWTYIYLYVVLQKLLTYYRKANVQEPNVVIIVMLGLCNWSIDIAHRSQLIPCLDFLSAWCKRFRVYRRTKSKESDVCNCTWDVGGIAERQEYLWSCFWKRK